MKITAHTPSTDQNLINYCGDSITFSIELDCPPPGKAWLRTNIGNAHKHRQEIIDHVEQHRPLLSCDWNDIPMHQDQLNPARYYIEMPLAEVGRFEAKAFFMPQDKEDPVWPDGGNVIIKVEPAATVCGNSIYAAFVRQFGPHMDGQEPRSQQQQTIKKLDDNGYTVIPKSGTFRKLISELDHIITTMGFNILQLLPIHPVPTTYARMGRFGSPFASIDFFDVDPALAEFDRKTTPLDQFCELTDAIHSRRGRIFLDMPINHTGWASHLQMHHPEWFVRDSDHSFVSPGAWGVTWEDLSELDYSHTELWQYMADVFLFWCRKGVDGFRCDAGYMVPLPVWEYITAKVRDEYPDTVFMLEGLGGDIRITENLLDQANLNWAYSEIFQSNDRTRLEGYLPHSANISRTRGTLVHFAETHDNNRLAAKSPAYARMRTALAALCSEAGAFGITNGVEWFATAKVDVHGAEPINRGATENQISEIAQLNKLLSTHPAFFQGVTQKPIHSGNGNTIAILRSPDSGDKLLIAANLDEQNNSNLTWPISDFSCQDSTCYDLLTGNIQTIVSDNIYSSIELHPLEILCLSCTADYTPCKHRQRQTAAALELYQKLSDNTALIKTDRTELTQLLTSSPEIFCQKITGEPAAKTISTWQWPQDLRRTVMLPHNHILLLKSRHPFHAELCLNEKRLTATDSIKANDGSHFAFLLPASRSTAAKLKLNLCTNLPESGMHHETSDILQLSSGNEISITTELNREAVRNSRHYALLTNNRGAISQVRLEWGHIESQYDCLLGANLHDSVPVDRQIVFTRCRAWLVHRDYSQAITTDCLQSVSVNSDNSVKWNFAVPAGMGKTINLRIRLRLIQERNCIRLSFERFACNTPDRELNPTDPVTLILRPDIEDRNFHETTKAHTGPETAWNKALKPLPDGFRFSTSPHHTLELNMPNSRFVPEAEWTYGVPHPFEAQRGLNDSGDLFSPGYLETKLLCDRTTIITAKVTTDNSMPLSEREITTHHSENIAPSSSPIPLLNAMRLGMQAFIVKRDDTRTVIAGYPWFLDWGRDTLICLRGIIAAEMYSEARDILIQFAHFEAQGTLPNMIRGNDDSNRDTTDAPLWFFTACSDFMQANPESDFLDTDCQGRTIRQILTSIASHYIDGTPNGIVMDSETALIFSPSHYTWMDTNHPAGTPREGYPIEIQALWFAALKFMATIDDTPRWKELALQVQQSIEKLYALPDRNYLADCLLASPGTPAKDAVQDNALRPNQLFAVTLGAVTDRQKALDILSASECLLIPGAIRSLADQPVSPPLPVYRDGQLLNDPERPFRGYYGGDEDTRRKPAYHNGTAWSWPFPSYCEALYIIGGESLRETALSIISSSSLIANSGCIGHIPEILDANSPHHQRGCQAQAWGDTELYRVLKLLQ